jgi:hypothetical protein
MTVAHIRTVAFEGFEARARSDRASAATRGATKKDNGDRASVATRGATKIKRSAPK